MIQSIIFLILSVSESCYGFLRKLENKSDAVLNYPGEIAVTFPTPKDDYYSFSKYYAHN